jgi:hypothetical protein
MMKDFPETGLQFHLYEIGGSDKTKTFWTKAMCKRACNLCVGLGWALIKWGDRDDFWLALSRISSHPVECHFGMTRSTLAGDVRWTRFFAAQVTASLMHSIMWTYGIRPYIRRFKNEAGCTLSPYLPANLDVPFGNIGQLVYDTICLLWENQEAELVSEAESVITPFIKLFDQLSGVQYVEKIVRPSELSGQCISNRWYILKHAEGAVLLALGDE